MVAGVKHCPEVEGDLQIMKLELLIGSGNLEGSVTISLYRDKIEIVLWIIVRSEIIGK